MCAPGKAAKAGGQAATGGTRRPRSPAASPPPHAGRGGGTAVAAAPGGKPAAESRVGAGVAIGVEASAPMATRRPTPRRGRARKAARVATAASRGARWTAGDVGGRGRAGSVAGGAGRGGWFRRPARTLVCRRGGCRDAGAAGFKAVAGGGGSALAADVAMRPAPPASAHRATEVVAPPAEPAAARPAAAQVAAGRAHAKGGAVRERAAAA